MSRYTRFSCVGSLCVTFSDWDTMGVLLYEVFLCWKIVLLSVTGRKWVSRSMRFSSVRSLSVTYSDWETMGVPLYEVFLCWKFVCYFQ